MSRAAEIREALEAMFSVEHIEVIDESEAHRGHAGYQSGGESHFRLRLRAPELSAMSRLQRHRAVHAALGPELIGRIHALALEIDA
ncbi:BolA family transcriptional regulator [Roseovarius sp. TE539]|uniref:BolA family protein n=1 Tax=Roseovarius sp. TE539 TaxID=2249812 RepID=UPI000DDC9E0F|nr:BolA family protein [Roseovarius sp. TE539]RBI74707.1 BolA family transcriptional regulator [Roseovarius sp. TE539]